MWWSNITDRWLMQYSQVLLSHGKLSNVIHNVMRADEWCEYTVSTYFGCLVAHTFHYGFVALLLCIVNVVRSYRPNAVHVFCSKKVKQCDSMLGGSQ